MDVNEAVGFGITPLESAERFEDLVAIFQASPGDAVLEFLEALGGGAWPVPCADVVCCGPTNSECGGV
jgi:hypothetical protein